MSKKKTPPNEIEKKVLARVTGPAAEEVQEKPLTDCFVEQCLKLNVMGDAELFAAVCRGRFLFNGNSAPPPSPKSEWYKWDDHYWRRDTSNSIKGAIGNDVAEKYEDLAGNLAGEITKLQDDKKDKDFIAKKEKHRDKVSTRAFNLRGNRAREVLGWVPSVAEEMVVDGEDFDNKEHLIVCGNGVINLETGELSAGDPDDKLTFLAPHDWPGLDAEPINFIKYLRCILAAPYDYDGDEEAFLNDRFEFLHRFLGAALHGAQTERAFMIFYGEHGWNGKGTLMQILLKVMGDYAAPLAAAALMKTNGFEDPSKPSPHIIEMKSRRFLFASETDEGEKFSNAKVKLFSGGERQKGRKPHDIKSTEFDPFHTIFMLLNDLPYANANDDAFWNRQNLIRFYWSYQDKIEKPYHKRRSPSLEADLKKEYPQILAWLVRGYHKYIAEGGINPPEEMQKEKDIYRFREDMIGQFVHACCKRSPDHTVETPFAEIQEVFDPWYAKNYATTKKKMSGNMLGRLLVKKFKKGTTKDNLPAYIGIELKEKMDYLND